MKYITNHSPGKWGQVSLRHDTIETPTSCEWCEERPGRVRQVYGHTMILICRSW